MSITTHSELKSRASEWLKRADLSAYLDDLVMAGEKWIMRNVRATEMETALNVTIAGGVATVPTGFLGAKVLYVDGSPAKLIRPMGLQQLFEKYPVRSSSGKPSFFAHSAGTLEFGPYPDSTYTVKGTYYKRQGPLSSAVYLLFLNNPDLYLFATLCEAEPFMKNDKRIPVWRDKRDAIAVDINTEAQGIAFSGGMTITPA